MARDYTQEYKAYQGTPEQKKRRAARNSARRELIRQGRVSKGDGLDVDHVNGNPKDNRPTNLKVKPKAANRSYPRTSTSRKKNPRD